jgi:diguanylate cyclase (GGDEF)-like protein
MQAENPLKLWARAWSILLNALADEDTRELINAKTHTVRLSARRTRVIVTRVRLVSGVLAALTPLWIVLDVWTLPPDVWYELAAMRVVTAVAFALVLAAVHRALTLRDAYRALFLLYAVPGAFVILGYLLASQIDVAGVLGGTVAGYAYLPFVMLAALAIFPLTVAESACLTLLLLLVHFASMVIHPRALEWPMFLASFWVLALIAAMSMLAGLSQLAFLMANLREAIHDGLTGCYSRRCGEELVELHYALAHRGRSTLALVLVELDNFRDINERFGQASGDAALKMIAGNLQDSMRSGDMLVRWTGIEYLLILPGASLDQANAAKQRLLSLGLGPRPDDAPFTASIGVAERLHDSTEDWWKLIDLASARMRKAREAGGNCVVAA